MSTFNLGDEVWCKRNTNRYTFTRYHIPCIVVNPTTYMGASESCITVRVKDDESRNEHIVPVEDFEIIKVKSWKERIQDGSQI